MYRQGDVALVPVNYELARVVKASGKAEREVILAEGEVTGHHHRLRSTRTHGRLKTRTVNGRRFVSCPHGATLTHEEHAAIKVDSGVYEIKQAREYTGEQLVAYVGD